MKVKVKSSILNPVKVGLEKRDKVIQRKSDQWVDSTIDILRSDPAAVKMADDVSVEIVKDGFVGMIDNPAARSLEFGVDEGTIPDGIDIAVTPELAPMRRALTKL